MTTKSQKSSHAFFKILFLSAFLIFARSVVAEIFITPGAPDIAAKSYVVIDHHSGKIIARKNPHQRHPPASLVKLMTSYVVFKRIRQGFQTLEDEVKISENAWRTGGSKSFIEVGKNIKLVDLLKGMIIQSGNDASVALAEHIAGSEATFVVFMNRYAKALKMENTRFENASGLPHKNQYTTAYDTAILSSAIIREFPEFYRWYREKEFTHDGIRQYNRNRLLHIDHTVDGLKTGFTQKAGYCLAASAKRLGMRLISVVLGAKSAEARTEQTQKLLDYGFRFFETQKIAAVSENIPVYKSEQKTLRVGLEDENTYLTLPRGQFKLLKRVVEVDKKLTAPIEKNQPVGKLRLVFDDKTVAEYPLVATEKVDAGGFFLRFFDTVKLLFMRG